MKERRQDINQNEIYKDMKSRFGDPVFNLVSLNRLRSEMPNSRYYDCGQGEEWSPAASNKIKHPSSAPVTTRILGKQEAFRLARSLCREDKKTGLLIIPSLVFEKAS